jgi:hypothetical protein
MELASLWIVFFVAAVLIGIAVLAMAIGVIFRRPCLRGSCGGEALRGPDGEPLSCGNCPRRTATLE